MKLVQMYASSAQIQFPKGIPFASIKRDRSETDKASESCVIPHNAQNMRENDNQSPLKLG